VAEVDAEDFSWAEAVSAEAEDLVGEADLAEAVVDSVGAAPQGTGDMKTWLTDLLNEDDLKKIEQQIQATESDSMAEIVVCVIKKSVPTRTLTTLFFSFPDFHHPFLFMGLLPVIFIIGRWASEKPWAIRQFMSPHDRQHLTFQRALLEFHVSDIKKTERSTGILICLSVAERAIHILADQAVLVHFPETHWTRSVEQLIDGIRKNQLRTAIIEVLEEMRPELKIHFPVKGENRNELPDHVVIRDQ
jgi:uncharacterized membrane protein